MYRLFALLGVLSAQRPPLRAGDCRGRRNREGSASAYAVRAADGQTQAAGQDGGAVTALLGELLAASELDGAVVARERDDEPLRGEAVLARRRDELRENAGSVFTQSMQLGELDRLVAESSLEEPDLALVGTPCVIQGASALQSFGRPGEREEIALTVAAGFVPVSMYHG